MVKMRGQEENEGKSEAFTKMVFKSLKGRVKVKRITVLRVKKASSTHPILAPPAFPPSSNRVYKARKTWDSISPLSCSRSTVRFRRSGQLVFETFGHNAVSKEYRPIPT
ncbi:hypothetical protein AAC387_Pa05g1903 [Persea americana]